MREAWVLGGGAALGALQVGQLMALAERGRRPDLLVGVSVGALHASAFAVGDIGTLGWLAETRTRVTTRDVFVPRWLPGRAPSRWGALAAGPSLFNLDGLADLIATVVGERQLKDLTIPTTVIARDAVTHMPVEITSGAAVPALLASCAIPGLFPPVRTAGRVMRDGGVGLSVAIEAARSHGADKILVLPAAKPPPAGLHGQLGDKDVMLASGVALRGSAWFTFARTETLIAAGYQQARKALSRADTSQSNLKVPVGGLTDAFSPSMRLHRFAR